MSSTPLSKNTPLINDAPLALPTSTGAEVQASQTAQIVALLYQHHQAIAADIDFFIIPYASVLLLAPRLEDFLSEAECQRAQQYRQNSDTQRFCCARLALRCLLSHYATKTQKTQKPQATINVAAPQPKEWPLSSTAQGKPQLPLSTQPHYYFNWAHSGDYVALAISADCQVGVDIEAERPLRDLLGIAQMLYSKEEQQTLQNLLKQSNRKAQQKFFQLWTNYEAHSKMQGTGLLARETGQNPESSENQTSQKPQNCQGQFTIAAKLPEAETQPKAESPRKSKQPIESAKQNYYWALCWQATISHNSV